VFENYQNVRKMMGKGLIVAVLERRLEGKERNPFLHFLTLFFGIFGLFYVKVLEEYHSPI
jgi:hypothetical protein